MRKAKFILTLTLLIVISMSTLVYAKSKNESKNLRGTTYLEKLDGDETILVAVGETSRAYTTITNVSANRRYLQVYTRIYKHGEGWQSYEEKTGMVNSGLQLASIAIYRNMNSDIYEYAHSGKCSVSQYYSSVIDDFMFVADQYYD